MTNLKVDVRELGYEDMRRMWGVFSGAVGLSGYINAEIGRSHFDANEVGRQQVPPKRRQVLLFWHGAIPRRLQ